MSDDVARDRRDSVDVLDEFTAYVLDDIAREYRRAFPDEQMSMKVEDGGCRAW